MKKTILVLAGLLVLAAMLAIAGNPEGNTVERVATDDVMYENHGTVTTNTGTVETNGEDGTVGTNIGTVGTNSGTVQTNDEEGTVIANHGTVTTNNGTVETNGNGDGNGGSTSGTVTTNNGEIITNNHYVETNGKNGTIETNNSSVGDFDEFNDIFSSIQDSEEFAHITLKTGNFGTITDNNGIIFCNGEGGVVENNGVILTDEERNEVEHTPSLLLVNKGTVNNNHYGKIWYSFGIVKTNDYLVEENFGTVEINTINGIVRNGTDEEGKPGTVEANYGTVIDDNIYSYGVEIQNTDGGPGTKLIQAADNTIVKLTDLFKRDGYELVGYTQTYQRTEETESVPDEGPDSVLDTTQIKKPVLEENPITVHSTEYEAAYPNLLTLIWRACEDQRK